MHQTLQHSLRIATLLFGLLWVAEALALSSVNVEPTGEQANRTTVHLFDSNDKPVAPDSSPNRFSNLAPGTYRVDVLVGGNKVGSRSTITLADGSNRLQVNSATGAVAVLPGFTPPWARAGGPFEGIRLGSVDLTAGVGRVHDDAPSLGVFIGPDDAVLFGESRVPVVALRSSFLLFRDGLPRCRWDIGGSFGDASTSTVVSAGIPAGWAYWLATQNSPGLGSTSGMTASLKTNYDNFYINWALPYQLKKDRDGMFYGEPGVRWSYSNTSYDGSLVSAAPGVSSTTNQDVKQNRLALTWDLGYRKDLGNGASLSASAGAGVGYYWAKYDGTQRNVCAPCAAGLQDFTLTSSGDKNGWGFEAGAQVRAGFKVAKDVEFVVLGQYLYTGAAAGVRNSPTPAAQPPGIVTYGRSQYNGQAGLSLSF